MYENEKTNISYKIVNLNKKDVTLDFESYKKFKTGIDQKNLSKVKGPLTGKVKGIVKSNKKVIKLNGNKTINSQIKSPYFPDIIQDLLIPY